MSKRKTPCPTEAEIAQRCAEVQATWDARTERSRAGFGEGYESAPLPIISDDLSAQPPESA